MTTFDEAITLLRTEARPLGTEMTRLSKAGRRVLAEPVYARVDAPRYDASAMDGFAISGPDVCKNDFAIAGVSYPGQPWHGKITDETAVRIMTGAEVPPGANRVIPIEMTKEHENRLRVLGAWPCRSHVRPKASDMKAGQIALQAGSVLNPRSLLVAAAADVAAVTTWRRPNVGVIASGDELVTPGRAADSISAIPDSLSDAILLLAREYGAQPGLAALVPDESAAILAAASRILAEVDVLVMIGGTSRGDRDFAQGALSLGLKTCFSGVAMKPGKPVWYGRIDQRHILGLPGNPTAAMTTARLFLGPLLRALGGRDLDGALGWRPRPLVSPFEGSGARESFLCAMTTIGGVAILNDQSASGQLTLGRSDTLIRLPPHTPAPTCGQLVDTLNF